MSIKNIENIKLLIEPVIRKYHVKKAGIFGSYARNEATSESDLDILVDLPDNISLLGFIALKQDLEDTLHQQVDIVEYDTIKPLLKERILKEEIRVL